MVLFPFISLIHAKGQAEETYMDKQRESGQSIRSILIASGINSSTPKERKPIRLL